MYLTKCVTYAVTVVGLWLAAPPANAEVRANAPAIVTRYCSGCHGTGGNSQLPYIPRLAGQRAGYLESRVAGYQSVPTAPVDETLDKIIRFTGLGQHVVGNSAAEVQMVGVAHAASDDDLKTAIRWYASQPPASAKSRTSKAIEAGRSLYLNGPGSQGVYACQTCHGPQGQGTANVPRIAGQHAAYVIRQLAVFRQGEGRKSPMIDVARHVESDQARAVAAYLQSR